MEQKSDHAPVVVNPFLIYVGLAYIAILLQKILPIFVIPRLPAQILGAFLIVLNFGLGLPALWSMIQAKTSPNPHQATTSLVLLGVYQISRNPMYIGLTLVFSGLLTYFQISWGLLFVPLVVWFITIWVIIPEEKYLAAKFGEEYLGYKSKVRRWI